MKIPQGARFHVTEREDTFWLAMSYPKQRGLQGAANRRVHDLGPDRDHAIAVAAEMNRRVNGKEGN